MSIRTIDLGSHSLEIDTSHGTFTIYGTGYRVDLSLFEASKMLSAMLMVIAPSSQLEKDSTLDLLQVSAISARHERLERITVYTTSLFLTHLTDCAYCKAVCHTSQTIDQKVLCFASCLLKNEALAPYQQQGLITLQDVITIVSNEINHHTSLYTSPTICSGCREGWCEGCIPDEITPLINIGDTVKLLGTEDTYEVKAIDHNFEGEGLAVGIWLPSTQAIEMISHTLVEKVTTQPTVSYQEFLEETVDNSEYNAYLDYLHTPKAEDY